MKDWQRRKPFVLHFICRYVNTRFHYRVCREAFLQLVADALNDTHENEAMFKVPEEVSTAHFEAKRGYLSGWKFSSKTYSTN